MNKVIKGMKRIKNILSTVATVVLLASCASAPIGDKKLLNFLQNGVTTRQDVFLHLAEPNATFESGRILIYRLDEDQAGYFIRKNDGSRGLTGKFSLVLAFDERGVLSRFNLVRINEEYRSELPKK
ncbi:hypothetical protein [Yokenella regensburgei]|uniref:hypothetical protein n=2 Tax=Pseudomonadota TaxID=1224 RepID=UPI0035AF9968